MAGMMQPTRIMLHVCCQLYDSHPCGYHSLSHACTSVHVVGSESCIISHTRTVCLRFRGGAWPEWSAIPADKAPGSRQSHAHVACNRPRHHSSEHVTMFCGASHLSIVVGVHGVIIHCPPWNAVCRGCRVLWSGYTACSACASSMHVPLLVNSWYALVVRAGAMIMLLHLLVCMCGGGR
jgi:hypothetical protein